MNTYEEKYSHRILTTMQDFTIDQLMLFIGGVLGSIGALLLVVQKSKCEEVNCCCLKCKRRVDLVIADEKLQLTGKTGLTPRRSERLKEKEINLEMKEPEPEPEN
tara:strand:- start:3388 stop:3702 length:315 start_codon:yes stop_codon:yes gene_type:complete